MTTLVECVEAGAAAAPTDKLAVRSSDAAMTYGELLSGARGLACRLARAGIGRGDRVGIWMEKTPECVRTILGVLLSGAAYVPLDPRSPHARCRKIALDCEFAAMAVDEAHLAGVAQVLAGHDTRLVLVSGAGDGRCASALGNRAFELVERAVTYRGVLPDAPLPGDIAYVLYTSGSTGTPKGVVHTHASGVAFAQWIRERFAIRPDDVFSSHAPFHFDLSISDLFAALGSGASVHLISATEGMLAPYIVRMLGTWGITVWYSVPAVLVSMLETGGLEERPAHALRLVFFAGEVFPTPQLRRLRRALPDALLVNLFGPTETNVCTYYEVPPAIPDDQVAPIPIGRACEHMETFVLGDDGAVITECGVEGTLWAKGANLMLGYWGDPERTARMLYPDPRQRAGVACCTGDRVRILPDGTYEFRGRRDHMVKTRGYRVELGEIEAVLAAHPAVCEAVAVPLPDAAIGNRIMATVVPRGGANVDVRALRAHLGAQLPSYMVPAGIEVRDVLPRTSTGKADRTLLRDEWEQRGVRE